DENWREVVLSGTEGAAPCRGGTSGRPGGSTGVRRLRRQRHRRSGKGPRRRECSSRRRVRVSCRRRWSEGSRHGVTITVLADALQLLLSSVSTTVRPPSAHARRKYVFGTAEIGIVSVTVPVWLAPAARPGTERLPVNSVSPALFTASSEREYLVADGPDASTPTVCAGSVTANVARRCFAAGGAETAVSTRLGLVTVTAAVGEAAQLLDSLLSATLARSSAQAKRK